MAIINRASQKTVPIETVNIFSAPFNGGGAGQYNFTIVPGNVDQIVIPLQPAYWYYIDRISLSASIDEGVYLKSISTLPTLFLRFTKANYRVYPRPIPAVNYKDGLEWCYWFYNDQRDENLLMTAQGILDQVAETVGVATLYLHVSFVIYEFGDLDIVRALRDRNVREIAGFYGARGGV